MKTAVFSPAISTFSFVISLLFVLFMTGLMVLHIVTLVRYQRHKAQAPDDSARTEVVNKFRESHKSVAIFYEGFSDKSLMQQSCLAVVSARYILASLITALLYQYPLTQAILLVLLSIFSLVYLFRVKPYQDTLQQKQQYLLESIVLLVCTIALAMAIMDAVGISGATARARLGKAYIFSTAIISIVIMLSTIWQLIKYGRPYFKALKGWLSRRSRSALPNSAVDESSASNLRRSGSNSRDIQLVHFDQTAA